MEAWLRIVSVIKSKLEEYLESAESDAIPEGLALEAPKNEEQNKDLEVAEKGKEKVLKETFGAPIDGRLASITETPDDAFSQKMIGDGVVFFPTGNKVYAPCDGSIDVLFPTLHAIGMTSPQGVELLIHVGIDTVNLKGEGFKAFIKQGDQVKAGDLLLEIDLDFIKKKAASTAVPVIFTNLGENQEVVLIKSGDVKAKF